MIISSAYIFAKQIKAGTAPLPMNVIYDSGRFNMARMKTGFALTNILTAQSVYPTANYSNGIIAIADYFTDQVAADDGKTFVTIGTEQGYLTEEGSYLQHIGTDASNDNVDGCCYFFPIAMQQLDVEDYDTINFKFDWSTAGITDPSQMSFGIFDAFVYRTNESNKLKTGGGGGQHLVKSETLTEYNVSFDLGGSGLTWTPTYVSTRLSHGTYQIKKIWFSKEH